MTIFQSLAEAQDRHDEVLKHYCTLSALVADHVFDYAHAADCFCRKGTARSPVSDNWRHDQNVPQFIEDAVVAAVAKKLKLDRAQVRRLLQGKRA